MQSSEQYPPLSMKVENKQRFEATFLLLPSNCSLATTKKSENKRASCEARKGEREYDTTEKDERGQGRI
jgi:hypothetical protein